VQDKPAEGSPPERESFGPLAEAWWRKPAAQRVAAVMVLLAAAALQYFLVNVPVGDVGQTAKFSPAKVKATDELVSFDSPESGADPFSFAYAQAAESNEQKMLVDAYFDQAALSEETLHRLAALGVHAPSAPGPISYVTSTAHDATCSTAFHVDTSNAAGDAHTVQFFQSEIAPSDRHRLLEVKTAGLDSTVTLSSSGSFAPGGGSPCRIVLRASTWEQPLQGFLTVKVKVAAGSSFRFRWEAADVKPTGWSSSGAPVRLVMFGSPLKQSFKAVAMQIIPSDIPSGRSVRGTLVATSQRKEVPLTVDSFLVGTDRIEFGASGRGRVLENGKVISRTNLIEAINQYPLIAALFGAANVALLGWSKRKFFPPRSGRDDKS